MSWVVLFGEIAMSRLAVTEAQAAQLNAAGERLINLGVNVPDVKAGQLLEELTAIFYPFSSFLEQKRDGLIIIGFSPVLGIGSSCTFQKQTN